MTLLAFSGAELPGVPDACPRLPAEEDEGKFNGEEVPGAGDQLISQVHNCRDRTHRQQQHFGPSLLVYQQLTSLGMLEDSRSVVVY